MKTSKKIIVTGGAGYVGAVLIPKLLEKEYEVKVIDLYLYGDEVLDRVKDNPRLKEVKGDIRDTAMLDREIAGYDTIIHLACISNDPSYELNPSLGKSINYDAFLGLLDSAKKHKITQFIYASSSSVYGIKDTPDVTEDMPLDPLTDYSKYKAKCEEILKTDAPSDMIYTVIRPATLCGYSPRQRLDLTVNILTNHAINNGKIKVFGGSQKRPNLHIEDMTDLYLFLLEQPAEKIDRKIYNVGYENHTVSDIAGMVQSTINPDIPIEVTPTDDNRSYHICSDKIKNELGFMPKHTLVDAIRDLKNAFKDGLLPDSMSDKKYFNIKMMQSVQLH